MLKIENFKKGLKNFSKIIYTTLISISIFGNFANAYGTNNIIAVQPNSTYIQQNISKVYNEIAGYEKSKELTEIVKMMLHNKDFKIITEHTEMGKTKVYTVNLLEKFLPFLNGETPYSNTVFDNNNAEAGLNGVLKDILNNDSELLSIPTNVINDIQNSIRNSQFFKLADKIKNNLNKLNFANSKEKGILIAEIMHDFKLLINDFTKTIIQIKALDKYEKEELTSKFRMYANAKLRKLLQIYNKYFTINTQIYPNPGYEQEMEYHY